MKYAKLIVTVIFLTLFGCKKKDVTHKIIEPLPVITAQVCLPAQATQAWFRLKRDALNVAIPVINRLSVENQTYNEISGPDGQLRYSFQVKERHYGTANFQMQFRDSNDAPIDPINVRNSTVSINTVKITGSGSFSLFSYTEDITLSLATVGDVTSDKSIVAISAFTGSSYSLTYTIPTPGAAASFEGPTEGVATATGTGPGGAATSLSASFFPDHSLNGNMVWEGQTGTLHIADNTSGFVVTSTSRLLLD